MATISNVNGKKITKIKYKGEIYDTGGGGSTLKTLLDATKSTYYLFYEYQGISVNDLISYNDTENVTNMRSMFQNCSNLTTIPLLNTSKVTNMGSMFHKCSNLTTISQLDTNLVTDMNNMFNQCLKLTTIPQLNTIKVKDMMGMFYNCYKLATIDITHMNITASYRSDSFAFNCFSLTKLIIRNMSTIPSIESNAFRNCYHFTGTTDPTYNPQGLKDARIYVPDDKVNELKTATNWSVYADLIVPLSTLVE